MDNNPTGPEHTFSGMLLELKIKFETQKVVSGKIFDFFIPEKNTIVEVDGSYWHGYGKTLTEMNDVQRKAYHNDKKKDLIAKTAGYEIVRVWEHELEDEFYLETKERIRSLLK